MIAVASTLVGTDPDPAFIDSSRTVHRVFACANGAHPAISRSTGAAPIALLSRDQVVSPLGTSAAVPTMHVIDTEIETARDLRINQDCDGSQILNYFEAARIVLRRKFEGDATLLEHNECA
jgi:hypothetical protein